MRMTMRWYGPDDAVTLANIRQVPVVRGIVSALSDVPVGDVWPLEKINALKQTVENAGLALDVIESIAVHDDIKLGRPTRDQYIEAYCESIRNLGKAGIGVLCYNFMPVFDWMRTDLAEPMPDGSTTLSYIQADLDKIDLNTQTLNLPAWAVVYTPAQLRELLAAYQAVGADGLFENLVYFLKAIAPVADEAGVKLGIHPDDPPWPIFGIPRIVSTAEDVDRIFEAVPNTSNGLTFCTGSFGSRADNDLPGMVVQFGDRIHFVHMRSVQRGEGHNFKEVSHVTGNVVMRDVVKALVQAGVDAPVRPDHGRMIWGETGRAGYGLYDRSLGAMYLSGLFEATQSLFNSK